VERKAKDIQATTAGVESIDGAALAAM